MVPKKSKSLSIVRAWTFSLKSTHIESYFNVATIGVAFNFGKSKFSTFRDEIKTSNALLQQNFHIQNQKWRWWGWQNNEMPICCVCSHYYNNNSFKAEMWFYEFQTGSRWCRVIFHIFSFCIMFWIWNLLLRVLNTVSHSEFVLWNIKWETCWCWFHVSINTLNFKLTVAGFM